MDFEVRAIVLYIDGLINDSEGRLSFDEEQTVDPVTTEGLLRDLEVIGQANFDVKFNRSWDFTRIDLALRAALPEFFAHCEAELGYNPETGRLSDGELPYAFCFRNPKTRKLSVYAKREPNGEDIYGVKSRKGRGASESFIHIASVAALRDSALKVRKVQTAMSGKAPSNSETVSGVATQPQLEASSSAHGATDKKGKKRKIFSISDDSDIELVEPTASVRAKKSKSRLLGGLDRALALADTASTSASSTIQGPNSETKATTGLKYSFNNIPMRPEDFSPSPSPISDSEPLPEIAPGASSSAPNPFAPGTISSTTAHTAPGVPQMLTSSSLEEMGSLTPSRPVTPSFSHGAATTAETNVSPTRYDPPTGVRNPWY